jgi:hypothetical protein
LTALAIVVAIPGSALAAIAINAPEIDGGSLGTGLGVVAASVLILRSRWRSR